MNRNTPEEALEVTFASISKSTLKQYSGAIKQWTDFTNQHNLGLFDTSVFNVLKFLSERFKAGAAYGTLNTYRSAISFISNNKIGESEEITRFMKGAIRLRPARPKYSFTWDVSIVLDYLEEIDTSSLKSLTHKVVMLLALSTAQQAQTLSRIKISNIKKIIAGLEIRIPEFLKCSGVGRNQPILQLPLFTNKEQLCIVSMVLLYIERTKNIRNEIEELFISISRPWRPISSETISRWLKVCLQKSRIDDVSIFSGHSTRHASSSKARDIGIDIETIRRTAGWSQRSQTFARFYQRPIVTDGFEFARRLFNNF